MTLLDHKPEPATPAWEEALIKEARRLRRRRWFFGLSIAALLIAAGTVGYLITSGPPATSRPAARASSGAAASSSPAGSPAAPTRSPDLIQPTTLAALPDGRILILDSSRDQILELRPDGALTVFAGNGRLGFSGDGGPARDAELDFRYFSSAGVAVTPNGSVDFLDDGNCRVRQIAADGIIRSLLRVRPIKVYPHGTACPLVSLAVSPAGELYVATDSQVERLTTTGRLVWVAGGKGDLADEPANPTPSTVVFSPELLAFNHTGSLYIGSFEPRVVYRLAPDRKLTNLGGSYPTALAAESNGDVLVGTHFGVIQQATSTGSRLRFFYSVNPKRVRGINWSTGGFQEDGIAVTPDSTVYVDNAQGNGYGDGTVLVRISRTKHAALAPIRTPLTATLPKLNAPGFPATLYPAARPSHGTALTSCPSNAGLQPFTPEAIAEAKRIARRYRSGQFASDIAVTDRSWWITDFNAYAGGDFGGTHVVTGEAPASNSAQATGLGQACGATLVNDSIAVTVAKSAYSDFAGALYFLDRHNHPLVYDVR